jgi:hypothetical protein
LFSSPKTAFSLRNRQKLSDKKLPTPPYQGKTMNLLQQSRKKTLSDKQETFLTALFESEGNFNRAAEIAGYSRGSVSWLRDTLAEEIIERTRAILAGHSLKAANKVVQLIDAPIERGDDLKLRAAEAVLNRVGLGKQETMNHNVQAVHGVVLLPPKKEVVIDAN